jgi:6-phosphogluconolactonase
VSAYQVDAATGRLSLINKATAEGRGPSHISLDRTRAYVLDANYGDGYVEAFRIRADGGIGERTALVHHEGRSINPDRQTRPYAHSITADPTNRFALACDLGTDRIVIYRFDVRTGALTPHNPPFAAVRAGSGPRHQAWHPDGRGYFVVTELANTVVGYAWDASRGTLAERQTISTLPAGYRGETTAAEIAVHPNGRFVYASNRGHDSLAVFDLDASGQLRLLEHVPTAGKTPRYFALDPTGQWILVSNIDTDNVAVFRIDAATGRLTLQGAPVAAPRPHGIGFGPAA